MQQRQEEEAAQFKPGYEEEVAHEAEAHLSPLTGKTEAEHNFHIAFFFLFFFQSSIFFCCSRGA